MPKMGLKCSCNFTTPERNSNLTVNDWEHRRPRATSRKGLRQSSLPYFVYILLSSFGPFSHRWECWSRRLDCLHKSACAWNVEHLCLNSIADLLGIQSRWDRAEVPLTPGDFPP